MPPGPEDLDDELLDDEELTEEPDEEEEDEGPEAEEEEPLEAEDEDEEPEPAPRAQRKPFAQRVNEVAERLVNERMRDLETKLRQPAPAQETGAQRNARLAEMEPWDRVAYETNERLARLEWEGSERLDQIAFSQVCRDDPVASRLKDEVERRLASMRSNGFNTSRDVLYTQILGERARANKGRATGRAAKTAAANRDRQTTRPGNTRTDAVQTDTRRGNNATARARRLDNVSI